MKTDTRNSDNMVHKYDKKTQKKGVARRASIDEYSGVYRWFAVLAAWMCWFSWDGMLQTLSILLPSLRTQLCTQTWILGWIATIVDAACDITGPLAAPLRKRFGSRKIIMICGFMTGAGFMLGSAVEDNVYLIGLVLVIFVGLGIGVSSVLTRNLVGLCFSKRYVLANGIAQTGTNFAHIILPPLVHLLLTCFGWRGTMLLIGSGFMHIAACGALLRGNPQPLSDEAPARLPGEASLLLTSKDFIDNAENCQSKTDCSSLCQEVIADFNTDILFNIYYWVILLLSCSLQNTFVLWRIYYIPHLTDKGVAPQDAALFLTIAGTVALIAKVVHGPFVDKGYIDCRTLLATTVSISTVGLLIDQWMDLNWQILTCGILVLPSICISYNLRDVLVKEIMGKEQLASAFGWLGMSCGIVQVAIGFLPGFIYDCTGSYDLAFIMLGCMQSLGLVSLVWLRYVERKHCSE